MADIFDMADTWNDAGTTFTAIKMDVTDTNSAAGSKLLDLLVSGASKFSVDKAGQVEAADGSSASPTYSFASDPDTGIYRAFANQIEFALGGTRSLSFFLRSGDARLIVGGSTDAGFEIGDSSLTNSVFLSRDAIHTLALRRGTNAQTFNIYNTFTDASNYERGGFKWNTNVLEVFSEAAGTGTARPMSLTPADIRMPNLPTADPTVAGQLWNDAGTLKVSAG